MTYVAPARAAILYLAGTGKNWDALSVATMAHITYHRASVYCRWLMRGGVLIQRPDECLERGWAYLAWVRNPPRTRPGGNGKEYRRDQMERHDRYADECQVRGEMGRLLQDLRRQRGLGICALARRAHCGIGGIMAIEAGKRQPRTDTIRRIRKALEEP